jgi:REP element-mobilizing transposase RayT
MTWIRYNILQSISANSIVSKLGLDYSYDMAKRGAGSKIRTTAAEQLPLWKPRGGKRRGAGRPPKGPRAGSPHKTRPELSPRFPVHVTLRAVEAVGRLRKRHAYHAIRWATISAARRDDFRIVQLSIQHNHVHLLVEADDKHALAVGMQGFQISAAKLLNAAISKRRPGSPRRGAVFPDRYHAEIITSPTQARHALAYVLLNWRRHKEDQQAPFNRWAVDWFASGGQFPGWAEYGDEPFMWPRPSPEYEPLLVWQPRTWLLAQGWKKIGATISCHEVPSAKR